MNKELKKDIKRLVHFEQKSIDKHLKQIYKPAKFKGLWKKILTTNS
jgi:uncharacterized protein (UPF0335 family)